MFHTRRLLIRKFEQRDINALLDLFGSADAMRYIGPRRPMSFNETKQWLDNQMHQQETGLTRFAVEEKGQGELVGVCGFQKINGIWDFGYYFRQCFWGRGYATEACSFLLGAINELLNGDDYQIFVSSENTASHNVMARCGFVRDVFSVNDGEEGFYYKPGQQSYVPDACDGTDDL